MDNYDEPVRKNVEESNKRMVQSVENFMPLLSPNIIGSAFEITATFDFMAIFTIPVVWWATATLLYFGPWDALLSTALSGFKDGLSDYATA